MLKQLGQHVEVIEFLNHHTNLPFLSIIQACPNLQQLAYVPTDVYDIDVNEAWNGDPGTAIDYFDDEDEDEDDEDEEDEQSENNNHNNDDEKSISTTEECMFPKMTVLCIDLIMSFNRRLAPIIKHCPNLRVLRTGNIKESQRFNMHLPPTTQTTNMTQTLKWCPKLQWIEFNNPGQDEDIAPSNCIWWQIQWDKMKINPQDGNLYHLVFYEPEGCRTVEPLINKIIKSQSLLRELVVGAERSTDAVWDGLAAIQGAPRIKKLYLDGIRCSETSAAAVIKACPSVEDLMVNLETQGEGYAPVFQVMDRLKKLRSLTINYKSNRFQDSEHNDEDEDEDHNAGNWREGAARRHTRQLAPFTNYLNGLSTEAETKLEKLEVRGRWDLVLTVPFLYSIGSISTLRYLELRPGDTELTAEQVIKFIETLNNTQLTSLTLSMFVNMSAEAYLALASLKHLQSLTLVVCEPCSDQDLINLFEKSKTISSVSINMGLLSESPFPLAGINYLKNNGICWNLDNDIDQRSISLIRN